MGLQAILLQKGLWMEIIKIIYSSRLYQGLMIVLSYSRIYLWWHNTINIWNQDKPQIKMKMSFSNQMDQPKIYEKNHENWKTDKAKDGPDSIKLNQVSLKINNQVLTLPKLKIHPCIICNELLILERDLVHKEGPGARVKNL